MGTTWPITWWAFTDRMTEFVDGISSPIMRNMATDKELSQRDLPIGACYAAREPAHYVPFTGGDGQAVTCLVPAPENKSGKMSWFIDGRASNCTAPQDAGHYCWVRHGTIGDPLHVDKDGRTCNAGGGSIVSPGWHGFLHNGVLREDADPTNRGPR